MGYKERSQYHSQFILLMLTIYAAILAACEPISARPNNYSNQSSQPDKTLATDTENSQHEIGQLKKAFFNSSIESMQGSFNGHTFDILVLDQEMMKLLIETDTPLSISIFSGPKVDQPDGTSTNQYDYDNPLYVLTLNPSTMADVITSNNQVIHPTLFINDKQVPRIALPIIPLSGPNPFISSLNQYGVSSISFPYDKGQSPPILRLNTNENSGQPIQFDIMFYPSEPQ